MNSTNKIFLQGLTRILLGSTFAVLIWTYLLKRGAITKGIMGVFAFCIAIALSGILILVLRKSFDDLSNEWAKIHWYVKLFVVIIVSLFLYFNIIIVGYYIFK